MNFNQFHYFAETAKTNSMRLAAQNLFVSQPSLSSAIRELEKELGFALFVRASNGVTLTPEGRKALSTVQQILTISKQFDEIKHSFNQERHSNITCQLNIYTVASQSNVSLPSVLDHFSKTYPNISLAIIEENTNNIFAAVTEKIADIGIISSFFFESDLTIHNQNPLLNSTDLTLTPILSERVYALVNSSSDLAKYKTIFSKSLLKYPLAVISNDWTELQDTHLYKSILSKNPFYEIKPIFSCSNSILLEQYVATHDCFAIVVPSVRPKNFLSSDRLKTILIKDLFSVFYVINRKDSEYAPIINVFKQLLHDYYAT